MMKLVVPFAQKNWFDYRFLSKILYSLRMVGQALLFLIRTNSKMVELHASLFNVESLTVCQQARRLP